jgi:thiol-disulfide isomerase/thioredoxin
MLTSLRLLAVFLALGVVCVITLADEPPAPDQEKKQGDAAVEPKKDAPPPLKVSDAAKPVLDKIKDAYAKLAGAQMAGTWTAEWEIGEEKGKESAEFTSSFAAPNKFRHETKNDLLFGSTGEQAYALKQNSYLQSEMPKARGGVDDLPKACGSLLKEKNPSLLLAVTEQQDTPFLADRAVSIDKGDDVTINGTAFTSLKVATEHDANVNVLVDPATSLIRQWSVDLKSSLQKRGQENVSKALMTIDYATVKPEAPAGADVFAWAPPPGAKDATKQAAAGGGGEAKDLEGKPAPAFELEDLDGKKVKLVDLKDNVVVLDFWATWCGPCRAGMPILDKVAQARKDKPLKVYAVNLEEDKDTIAAFVKESKLGLPVLLDSTGETGKAYGANAIPETVIIGKDGVVKKVMIGLHPQEELEKAIDEVLK